MRPSSVGGDGAPSWPTVEAFYTNLATKNDAFNPLAELVQKLAQSEFAAAGLCAATSMHELMLGPSRMVFQNPHLRIAFQFDLGTFLLFYVDGSAEPWEREVSPEHAFEIVARFLTKRARWYKVRAGDRVALPSRRREHRE